MKRKGKKHVDLPEKRKRTTATVKEKNKLFFFLFERSLRNGGNRKDEKEIKNDCSSGETKNKEDENKQTGTDCSGTNQIKKKNRELPVFPSVLTYLLPSKNGKRTPSSG